jgi:hypothetical protein
MAMTGPNSQAPRRRFEFRAGNPVHISVTDAKDQLTDLVRRAGAGDEIILAHDGRLLYVGDDFAKTRCARRSIGWRLPTSPMPDELPQDLIIPNTCGSKEASLI